MTCPHCGSSFTFRRKRTDRLGRPVYVWHCVECQWEWGADRRP